MMIAYLIRRVPLNGAGMYRQVIARSISTVNKLKIQEFRKKDAQELPKFLFDLQRTPHNEIVASIP